MEDNKEVYEGIRKCIGRYRKSREERDELATQFWYEFMSGGYLKIYEDESRLSQVFKESADRRPKKGKKIKFDPAMPHEERQRIFILSFVRKRCLRQMTIQQVSDRRFVVDVELDEILERKATLEEKLIIKESAALASRIRASLIKILPIREKKVVIMLSMGWNRREIAKRSRCSLGTVQNIVERLKDRPEITALREVYQ